MREEWTLPLSSRSSFAVDSLFFSSMSDSQRILFLCTGNYYRSRFAEELYNHLAIERGLDWVANSAALNEAFGRTVNVGSLSVHTVQALAERGITPRAQSKMPRQLDPMEMAHYDRVIALSESEHKPMLADLHPELVDQVEFWTVEDLHLYGPEVAIPAIEAQVRAMFAEQC